MNRTQTALRSVLVPAVTEVYWHLNKRVTYVTRRALSTASRHPPHLGNKTKKVVLSKPATAVAAPYYLQNPPYARQTSYSFQIENFPPH